MNTGKLKKENKYLSILLIPHNTDNTKVIKFSSLYSKLIIFFIAGLGVLLCLAAFLVHTIIENRDLKAASQTLNQEKKTLSDQNVELTAEIETLKQKEDEHEKLIKDYTNKYKEITDNYINNNISRSGDRSDRSFINDINELKRILDNIGQSSKTDNTVAADMTEAEGKLKDYIDTIPTLWPVVGRISSKFGDREDPFWSNTRFHSGIDIAVDYGTDIKASGSGKVTFSGYKTAYGYVVFIDHGHDMTTVYGHASRLLVKEGQVVGRGDIIAKVGSSGRSTGPHLHFEVRINDNVIDPVKYLDSK